MSPRPKVLFVVTSHDKLGAHPYEVLAPHVDIIWASPKGGESPLDPMSAQVADDDLVTKKFLTRDEKTWKITEKLEMFLGRAEEFAAVFYVGGWGPMFDLATDPISHKLINEFYNANKIISSVCHGPAALAKVKLPSGKYFLHGEPVTGYSNVEEEMAGVRGIMPFSLETQLDEASGGNYSKGEKPYDVHVVVGRGGKLINGQNPPSAGPTGQAILDEILKG
ncbi:related to NonF protein, involved in nonactin biosynthesis [Phialocephala subalpina]|uniref:D-lactate dehydratase n=1 Tax=Phialocephala subalpina TaxID=576137 RepID=A0A1L7XNR3_9HELO|nr:related to NonF protein, involved in nonactin biosynthesis [Phialocephala subalpina]